MGMEHFVSFPAAVPPSWSSVSGLLAKRGFPVQVRMIDGELAFPDETPADDWRELRLGTPQGMVTVRREPERIAIVTWGNADAPLREAWNAIAWAFAEISGGQIESAGAALSAAEFGRTAPLPATFRMKDEQAG